VKVAAYQAPLLAPESDDAFESIRGAIAACEAQGVDILCCPEAILGGLADDAPASGVRAIDTSALANALAPLASECVTTIVGFTERAPHGALYNAAAVLYRGSIAGIYRKRHPAIHRSVYAPGADTPVFTIDGLTFGIIICNDSNHPQLARDLAARGAHALFVPSNNGLPPEKSYPELVSDTRRIDAAIASRHRMWVIRADVAGCVAGLVSDGASGIVNSDGQLVASCSRRTAGLLIAEITPRDAPSQTPSRER
jgi:predicted amidohydrolase